MNRCNTYAALVQTGFMFHLSERLVMTSNLDAGYMLSLGPYIRYGIAIGTSFKKKNHENKRK
ncbi:hypothetical protein TBC1_112142 [Lentimicrobium saccharophilum]|uniref:Uncharacterized protein n=1 Tax=Lentimicrobium saccharophilum TaxID=1678841 RepID=A0A0S7C591_9BACT|nr:hypothetical protein [Lentimicrobium saccharophilum]GAP43983.1 hypothetical protein TBC1_112142 [Lentimicrobium saccharophilum]